MVGSSPRKRSAVVQVFIGLLLEQENPHPVAALGVPDGPDVHAGEITQGEVLHPGVPGGEFTAEKLPVGEIAEGGLCGGGPDLALVINVKNLQDIVWGVVGAGLWWW